MQQQVESTHPVLLEVKIEDCKSIEQMIRRFTKKVKKFRLMEEINAHNSFVSPSEEKRKAKKEAKRKQRKQQREFEEKTKNK